MPIEGWDAFMAAAQELSGAVGGGGVPVSGSASGGGNGIPLGSMDAGESYDLSPDENWRSGYAGRLYQSGYRANPNDTSETLYAPGSAMNPIYGPGSLG